jgi:hypothetical protein
MIQQPLSMAPDLIFDEIRGAIEAGIWLMRLGVGLQREKLRRCPNSCLRRAKSLPILRYRRRPPFGPAQFIPTAVRPSISTVNLTLFSLIKDKNL